MPTERGLSMNKITWGLNVILYTALSATGLLGLLRQSQGVLRGWELSLLHFAAALTLLGAAACLISWSRPTVRMWTWEMVMIWPTAIGLLGFSTVTITSTQLAASQSIRGGLTFTLVVAMAYRGVELVQLSQRRRETKQRAEE